MMNQEERKKYKIRVISIQAGDPTFKMVFKNISGEAIEDLQISMELELSEDVTIFNNYTVGTCQDNETVILMKSFDYSNLPHENITGNLTLTVVNEPTAEFILSSDTGVGYEPQGAANDFTVDVVYLDKGEEPFSPTNGDTLIIQSRDESQNLVFLVADSNNNITLKETFNSIEDPGGEWLLESGSTSENYFSLNPKNINSRLLHGDTEAGVVTLVESESSSTDWTLPYKCSEEINLHRIHCVNDAGEKRYLHNNGSTVDLVVWSESESDAKTWYLHKVN